MRSHVDRVRVVAEHGLRVVALVSLGMLLWRSRRPAVTPDVEVARADRATLARWTVLAPGPAHVVFDAAPAPATRDWVRALRRAGTPIRWSMSRPIDASAVVTEPVPQPDGVTRVRLASVGGPVALRDAAGLIDTLPTGGARAVELATVAGRLRMIGPTFVAATVPRDTVTLRPVLVLGAAGWESKFTIAALEERGWQVASRVRVAPSVEVTQGPLAAVDTARYAAVIVLDSTAAASATAIARYARTGGGVVLAGAAARIAPLATISPGGVGPRVPGVAGAVASRAPRDGLGAFTIARLRPDAVTLDARGAAAVVAARRVDAGRVVQVGYDETWRWRMAGGDDAVAAHRDWWSRLVASVAYAPVTALATTVGEPLDDAPLASLIDALGTPTEVGAFTSRRTGAARTTAILFGLVLGCFLLEWASRRLRGAR